MARKGHSLEMLPSKIIAESANVYYVYLSGFYNTSKHQVNFLSERKLARKMQISVNSYTYIGSILQLLTYADTVT